MPETEDPTSGKKHWWKQARAKLTVLIAAIALALGLVVDALGFWAWVNESGAIQAIGRQFNDARVAWGAACLLLVLGGLAAVLWRRTARASREAEIAALGKQHADELKRQITELSAQKDAEIAALREQHAVELDEAAAEASGEKAIRERRVKADIRLAPGLLGALAQGGATRK